MLTDEQVLPCCFYWAKKLCNRYTSFDELVNEAYIVGKKLNNPLLLQKWIKWTMIHFTQKPRATSDDNVTIEDTSFNFLEFADMQGELLNAVNRTCSDMDKELIYMVFWHGLTYREVAKNWPHSYQAAQYRVKTILKRLREDYDRRSKRDYEQTGPI